MRVPQAFVTYVPLVLSVVLSAGVRAEPNGHALPSVQAPTIAEVDDESDDELDDAETEAAADPDATLSIANAPATRYGKMSARTCLAEVRKRKLPVIALGEVRGVPIPVRITGELHGVRVHSGLPKSQWASSPYEIVDCRMALAIDDFTALLAKHDVVELVHMSAYRPPSKKWPAGKPGKRHGAAMALDAAVFVKRDGTRLVVEKNFKGRRHSAPCPTNVRVSAHQSRETREIRSIFCEARDTGLFHVMLSPNFNWAHRNHFHLEVAAHPRWFYVR